MELYFVAAAVLICFFIIAWLVTKVNSLEKGLDILKNDNRRLLEKFEDVGETFARLENIIAEDRNTNSKNVASLTKDITSLKTDVVLLSDQVLGVIPPVEPIPLKEETAVEETKEEEPKPVKKKTRKSKKEAK